MLKARSSKCCVYVRQSAVQVFQRHFAKASKTKFSATLRKKDGRQLALEHFDFYYKPIFRHDWPSVRLGLTSRSKTCAIVNNFGSDSSGYSSQFQAVGAMDLIKSLAECREQRLPDRGQSGDIGSQSPYGLTQAEEETFADEIDERKIELDERRSAEALNQFVPATRFITRDTVPRSHKEDKRPAPLDTWKSEDVQFISDEDISYPKYLRVFVFPLGDISKFEDSVMDEISSVRSHQIIDAAALFPVLALDVRPEETVLDICAAPGEKALALLQTLIPCNLVCNDISPGRVNLLRHNICTYIQENDDARSRVRFLRLDAAHLGDENIGVYDKVLVDVPSTEDRKSLRMADSDGNLFRRSMITERLRLPDQQTEILIGGLKALRRGGSLVYTTSTLSPNQNDEVVETALRRIREDPEGEDSEFAICDLEPMTHDFSDAHVLHFARRRCRYGQLVIPFLPNNYGPVYTCKLKRLD